MFFGRKKRQHYNVDLCRIVSLDEARAFDIGHAGIIMSKAIQEISGSENLQYSLNYDGQKFKDKKKLEDIAGYSKYKETVELSGYKDKILFIISNVLLNTSKPEEFGRIHFSLTIHKDLWNEATVIPAIEKLLTELCIDFGTGQLCDTKHISWAFEKHWFETPLEVRNGLITGIYNMNFLNKSQAESGEIQEIVHSFGNTKTMASGHLLWTLSKSELSALQKQLKTEGKRMLTQ